MTPEEETQIIERLTKKYVLIPKGRFYHFVGGAVAIFVVAIGINMGSFFAALKSTKAYEAQQHIFQMEKDAEKHLAALRTGEYVQTKRPYKIQTDNSNFWLFISKNHMFNGADVVIAEGRAVNWQFVPVSGE
jgi:methylthioribose-1-phosphate isomerase